MVGFIVKAPLANNQIRTGVFDLFRKTWRNGLSQVDHSYHFDHFGEFLVFVLPQFFVIFDAGDVQFMLRLRLGWLERAC